MAAFLSLDLESQPYWCHTQWCRTGAIQSGAILVLYKSGAVLAPYKVDLELWLVFCLDLELQLYSESRSRVMAVFRV